MILVPSRRDRPPQGPVTVSRRYASVAQGAWLFSRGPQDISGRGRNGAPTAVSFSGLGANFAAANSAIYLPIGSLDASTEVTAVVRALTRSAGGGGTGRFLDTGTSQGVGYLMSRFSAETDLLMGGTADYVAPSSAIIKFNRWQTYLFTQGGAVRQAWVDGELVSSIAGYSGLGSSSAVTPAIGNRSDGWEDRAFDGLISSVVVIKRGTVGAEAQELSRSIWQMLEPERRPVFYSLPSSGSSTANRIMLLRRPGLSRMWR